MKTLLILAGLVLPAPARAAFIPVEIPRLQALPVMLSGPAAAPMTLSTMAMPLSPLPPAPALPAYRLPVSGPRNLPGVWNEQPLQLPAEAAVPVPAHDKYELEWAHIAEAVTGGVELVEDALFDDARAHPALVK
jgi:hypothetical protein